jgi:hypothetical protein
MFIFPSIVMFSAKIPPMNDEYIDEEEYASKLLALSHRSSLEYGTIFLNSHVWRAVGHVHRLQYVMKLESTDDDARAFASETILSSNPSVFEAHGALISRYITWTSVYVYGHKPHP